MKIAILGAGFTGLTAALRLVQKGHQVTIFEKNDILGGLAVGFSQPNWSWTLEKGYHHWFTNDDVILKLARELKHKVIIKKPATDVLINNQRIPLDTPLSLLYFPYLPFIDRIRTGLMLLYLKLANNNASFQKQTAISWINKWMGQKVTSLIWEPLLEGKFGEYKNKIALSWFWARIKKRTSSLAYPEKGYKDFAERLGNEVQKLGGIIISNTTVLKIKSSNNKCYLKTEKTIYIFDKIISTLPSSVFTKIATGLPKSYTEQINSIPHLHAQVLILTFKKPFMDKTYWLNITDKNFPFLVLAEHTNFMDPKHYGNEHILYVGNYLPLDHPYLKLTAKELLKIFQPYLKKINSHFSIVNCQLFIGPFAQPVVTTNYHKLKPDFITPLKNIYLANLDMVYPWDRGTNYAAQLGQQAANLISND